MINFNCFIGNIIFHKKSMDLFLNVSGDFLTNSSFSPLIATTMFKLEALYAENTTVINVNISPLEKAITRDVSFVVPTAGLNTATWVPGTSAHSWQAVAAGGTSIGTKGMIIAAKTLALTGMQLLDDPKTIEAAKKEFINRRGVDFIYTPMLGDRKPALNYRN